MKLIVCLLEIFITSWRIAHLSSIPKVLVFLLPDPRQGMKLTFLARSHLTPKFSKVVAKAKKLGAIKKKDS